MIGLDTDNFLLLGLARGQTELYRAMTDKGGIPLVVDLVAAVDGKGITAGIARKFLAGSRVTTVSRIESTPVADELFVTPAGWKREARK